jgi:hypothetical protein
MTVWDWENLPSGKAGNASVGGGGEGLTLGRRWAPPVVLVKGKSSQGADLPAAPSATRPPGVERCPMLDCASSLRPNGSGAVAISLLFLGTMTSSV